MTEHKPITVKQAVAMVATLINEHEINGRTRPVDLDRDFVSVEYSRIWGLVSCTLSVNFDIAMGHGRDSNFKFIPKVQVNCPSTYRDVPTMVAFLALTQEVTTLAGLIQSFMDQQEIREVTAPIPDPRQA
jgi:hypothetical protein